MSDKRNFASLANDTDVDSQINLMMNTFLESHSGGQTEENEQSETQSVDKNNNDTLHRPKRPRKNIDRYGLTEDEENDDSLFDQIDAQTSSNEATDTCPTTEKLDTQPNECIDPSLASQLTIGEKILFQKLIEVSTHIKVLQKTLLELELNQRKAEIATQNLNSVDDALLQQIGLPLANEENITDFNNKLKKKTFWTIVVSILKKKIDITKKFTNTFFSVQYTKSCWRRVWQWMWRTSHYGSI